MSEDPIVYITKTGKYYHKKGCRGHLKYSEIPCKLSEALSRGYQPCPNYLKRNNSDFFIACFMMIFAILIGLIFF